MPTHNLCFNHFSIDEYASPMQAYQLLFDSFQGALALNTGDDSFVLHFDGDDFSGHKLGENYTFDDFKNELRSNGEIDFLRLIMRLEDHSPFLNFILDDDIAELSKWTAFFPNLGYEGATDILTLAWYLQGFLLSLNTDPYWESHTIQIAFSQDHSTPDTFDQLRNISLQEHGRRHRLPDLQEWSVLCPTVQFSDTFIDWELGRTHQERALIRNKVFLAYSSDFDFHRPLIDGLHNSRHQNLRELRIGGQIRILFARLPNRRAAVLVGLFKHGKDKEYNEAIKKADSLLDELLLNNN